jgi:hypothetical protein
MSEFKTIKDAVTVQFNKMSAGELFTTGVSKDLMWETYLASFPPGTNPMFRERTEHDCQCCKQFIRACGNVVSIVDNKLMSIWDIQVDGFYQEVADAMAAAVRSQPISGIFRTPETRIGTDFNRQQGSPDSPIITWSHFFTDIPGKFVLGNTRIGTECGAAQGNKDVSKRSLEELPLSAVSTIVELIEQGSLYRGDEHLPTLQAFQKAKAEYEKLPAEERDNFCWIVKGARIRNTVIGSLLIDIAAEVDLDAAVRSFEAKVAPTNYKRPTALITKSMIDNAQKKVEELGLAGALQRRYAVSDDLTINNVLFADRAAKKAMNVFEDLAATAPASTKKLDKVEEVPIETFLTTILPKAETIAVLFENKHENNLMSLIAPTDPAAPPMFKWGNNFSWAYNGEVADSIKERVKAAGGSVTGVLRCSLAWFNRDDLDIHLVEPGGRHIYFSDKLSPITGGTLDVDMNAIHATSRTPVENITYPKLNQMQEGRYHLYVNQYNQRETSDVGFTVEIEFAGTVHTFHYDKAVKGDVTVATFDFTREGGLKFVSSLPTTSVAKEVWGVTTGQFHNVQMLLNSPNHWDGEKTGNKHVFFILDKCKNPGPARGFFNEFLRESLNEHRKVFEVLGSKLKAPASEHQLSGLGFSSTQMASVLCKITGAFTRTIKIVF